MAVFSAQKVQSHVKFQQYFAGNNGPLSIVNMMYDSQLTQKSISTKQLSVDQTQIWSWTHCKICMEKLSSSEIYDRMDSLKWVDFIHENSLNNGKYEKCWLSRISSLCFKMQPEFESLNALMMPPNAVLFRQLIIYKKQPMFRQANNALKCCLCKQLTRI